MKLLTGRCVKHLSSSSGSGSGGSIPLLLLLFYFSFIPSIQQLMKSEFWASKLSAIYPSIILLIVAVVVVCNIS